MAENVKVVSVKQGHDPRDFALVAFGGAGTTHAGALMSAAGARRPRAALARHPLRARAAQTDLRHDSVRTHLRRLDTAAPASWCASLAALAGEGRAELSAQGVAVEQSSCGSRVSYAMRARPTKLR